jgi:hypothetical protein
MRAFQDRRAPWYLRGLIRKPRCEIGVILLHDVERRFSKFPLSIEACRYFLGRYLRDEEDKVDWRASPLVCTENLNPDVVMVKPAEDRV